MIKGELSFQQIYNQLFAGKRLVLYFGEFASAETFRTRMHHHKAKQWETMENLGLANAEEQTVFSFRTQKNPENSSVVAYAAFSLPSPLKKYPVLILEEGDLSSGKEEVSRTMGEAQTELG